jgi:TldD protein
MRKLFLTSLALVLYLHFSPAIHGQDMLMKILDKEMAKVREDFMKKEQPPYFIDMHIYDIKTSMLQFSSGMLTAQRQSHDRVVTAGMRIGSYASDNTSAIENLRLTDNRLPVYSDKLPFEDDSAALCFSLDRSMEMAYDQTLQQFKTHEKNSTSSSKNETIPAFSVEKPSVYYDEPVSNQPDEKAFEAWKEILREVSGSLSSDADIITSDVGLLIMDESIYYLNSEGTRIVQNRPQYQLQIIVGIKTQDGGIAPMTRSYVGREISVLPSADQLREDVLKLQQLFAAIKKAPLADPYAGPAILSPEAAGVFFHEIFGHRIEGQRMNSSFDSQTFLNKVGKQVINEDISVVSDPNQKNFNGMPLFGYYSFDDEGVQAQKVTVVDKGILREFLMSRIPIKGQLHSNGHGRSQLGSAPYSRQSNLFITATGGLSDPALRKLLVKVCKKQGKSYGYYVKEVFGGFTSTDLFSPQVFNILPTLVYRVYTDGRPDELVRGVSFIGTPLAVFSEIMAAGDDYKVFNGFCGAESGNVPVSTISPAFLIKKIETQKMPEANIEKPYIPSPVKTNP